MKVTTALTGGIALCFAASLVFDFYQRSKIIDLYKAAVKEVVSASAHPSRCEDGLHNLTPAAEALYLTPLTPKAISDLCERTQGPKLH